MGCLVISSGFRTVLLISLLSGCNILHPIRAKFFSICQIFDREIEITLPRSKATRIRIEYLDIDSQFDVTNSDQIKALDEFLMAQKSGWRIQRFPPNWNFELEFHKGDRKIGWLGVNDNMIHTAVDDCVYYKELSSGDAMELMQRIDGICCRSDKDAS